MFVPSSETLVVESSADVVAIRRIVRTLAVTAGFGLIDQTKIVTTASELARNLIDYGGGGTVLAEVAQNDRGRPGVRLTFEDRGPGIADIELALTDGYTTGGGLGMGLSGSRRLMSDFHIDSHPGEGTRVTVAKWK